MNFVTERRRSDVDWNFFARPFRAHLSAQDGAPVDRTSSWMSRLFTLLLLAAVSAFGTGCEQVRSVVCLPVKVSAKAPAPESDEPDAAVKEGEHAQAAAGHGDAPVVQDGDSALLTAGPQSVFALPFAWEKSPQEPLALARTFLREVADDNSAYMTKGPEFFRAFANAQTPRATVVACADSRVQAGAFDATAENDDFTVRNIGNQVETALGSIQYGVEHLHTPVLLILGHTGCGAVKAAMEGGELPEAIQREIATLHVAKSTSKKGVIDDRKWVAAVLDNIHDQVKNALRKFGPRVNAGELTIVGAVYDFRNDLGQGAGRLAVIDVNGVQDPARLKSFVQAIMSGAPKAGKDDAMARIARALANPGPPTDEQGEDDQTIPH
jgi:carbonic anhydrase